MKLKKIGTRMLVGILPPVVLAMALLTVISAGEARTLISDQTQERMTAELAAQSGQIAGEMSVIQNTVNNITGTVASGYKSATQSSLETALQQLVKENDAVYGSGIWFEPGVFKASEQYMAPYAHRSGESESGVTVTYERSTPEYDYFGQEFYLVGKDAEKPLFLGPRHDDISGLDLITCVMPMYNMLGNFVGCVTVDMELSTMADMVERIRIGERGDAMLLSGDDGAYLGHGGDVAADSILEEQNASVASAGAEILAGESGIAGYTDGGETFILYYDTIPEVNWKLVMRIPQSQLDQPIVRLVRILTVVAAAAVVFSLLAILLQVRSISRSIKKVQGFAETLAQGDFSVDPMTIVRRDELGRMGKSLNTMYESNREVLGGISVHAGVIGESSEKLNGAAEELSGRFEEIERLMHDVNEAMISAGSSTEEVNASMEEISSSVNMLVGEVQKSREMGEEIRKRAEHVEAGSRASCDNAVGLSEKYEENLARSIENAKVVEAIGRMADVISGIAEQIDLLSLNASIEAARAGGAGRGFAVVAMEIGKLAGETSNAVEEIQRTVRDVKHAFDLLTADSGALIGFLKETVAPDYGKFVGVAKQYGEDAAALEESSARMSEMAEHIDAIMGEAANALQHIAQSARETADNGGRIMETVERAGAVAGQVSEMAGSQEDIAGELNEVVGKFKLI